MGRITVSPEPRDANSSDEMCRYLIEETGNAIDMHSYRYTDGRYSELGVYDVNRRYGGYAPAEVYSSTITAYRDVGAAEGGDYTRVAEYPDIAGGMVTDSSHDMTLAGKGPYWFNVGISGDAYPGINDAFVKIGKRLAGL